MASNNEYLILRHEAAKYHDLVPRLVLRRTLTGSKFEEDNSSRCELHAHRTDWVTTFTLVFQKFLSATSMPVMWFGYVVEFFLNLWSLNEGFLGILRRIITLSLKIPWSRKAPYFQSFLGHMDNRYDLHSNIPINHYFHLMEPLVGLNDLSPITLTVMASKLSYENKAFIKNVVRNQWKMHFVHFFSCYNKYLRNRATQAFIFTNKADYADLIVLAFRGTEPFNTIDWMTDIDLSWLCMGKLGRVHLGFMRALGLQDEKDIVRGFPKEHRNSHESLAYYTIRKTLQSLLLSHRHAKILITGHSLGGALAILFPAILALHEENEILSSIHGVVTFGQPRVGDAEFGRYMESVLGRRYYRVVYRYDVVSRVPFDKPPVAEFKHFGTCIYFKDWKEGEVVDDSPNPNYMDPAHFVSMHFSALRDLIKALLRVKEFEESLVSLLIRACGLLLPGVACHSLRDYVNSGKMANIKHKL